MIVRRVTITTAAMMMAATAAFAQSPPPVNPVLPTVTGTNAEPVIYDIVNLSTSDLLTGAIQFKATRRNGRAVQPAVRGLLQGLVGEDLRHLLQGAGEQFVGSVDRAEQHDLRHRRRTNRCG